MTEPLVAMRSMDRILPLLSGVKQSGNQATAVCPVCRAGSSNHKHNLSVTYFPQLRETKTNCFSAECPRSAVLDALGLPHWAAYDDPPRPCEACEKLAIPDEHGRYIHEYCAAKQEGRQVTRRRPRRPQPKRVVLPKLPDLIAEPPARKFKVLRPYEVVAEWEHYELTGELKARSVRKERTVLFEGDDEPTVEKFIRPHYFDPAAGGRWCRTKAESPVESVPVWRLPEVRAGIEAGEPVWGTEGHKAAEAVLAMGGCSTTVLLGALDAVAAEGLSAADFRYICDRDATGYAKGIKAMKAAEGLAARRSLWLPAVDEPGADAADHLRAGYGLDQFIPTDLAHLEVLEVLASARGGRASNGRLKDLPVEREARAWMARAEAAAERGDDEAAAAALSNAHLWVRAAGHRLRQLLQYSAKLHQLEAASEDDLAEMAMLVAAGAELPRRLYEEFDVDVDEDLVAALAPPAPPAPPSPPSSDGAEYDEDDNDPDAGGGPDATVYTFPAPEQEGPKWALSVPGDWRYDDGTNTRRGVYCAPRRDDPFYVRMAPLPYVHFRIIRRDGRGNVTAVDYVLSATPDGPQLTVTRDELGDGRWANRLGLPLSWDPKVRQASATAIEDYAARVAPERESIPRIGPDSGLLELPVDLCDQYFHTAPCSREEGLQLWRAIVEETAIAPKLAHLIGASSISPYSRSISRTLPHWVSLTGGMGRGKSQAMKLAAGVWGDSAARDTTGYLYGSWSASHQAVPQMLGELSVMPTFLDEAGSAGFTKQQWGQLIYRISLGASRKRTNIRDGRVSQERAWHSILFTSANDDLTAGIDSGIFQGTLRRVIEISAPPTASAEQGNRLVNEEPLTPGLLQRCYGHLGLQIAETVTVGQAVQYLQRARALLPAPEGDVREIAALLQLHLAGAVMVDDVLGTGHTITDAALQSVQDVLAGWLPGQSEGDRVVDLIRESTNAEPLGWPGLSDYDDAFNGLSGSSTDRHRTMIKDIYGLRRDDGWIAVLPSHWRRFLAEANVSPQQAQAELEQRGLLIRNESAKNRDHTYQTTQRFGRGRDSKVQRVYKVYLPEPDDQDGLDAELEPPEPDTPPPADQAAPTRDVTGGDPPDTPPETPANTPPTRGVTGVTGPVSGETAGVTAANTPAARGVTGVTGFRAALARMGAHDGAGARVRAEEGDREELAMGTRYLDRGGFAGWSSSLETSQACVVCGVISSIAMDHMPIHPLCWERSTRSERAQRIAEISAKSAPVGSGPGGWTALPQPYPDCAVCGTPAGQALAGLPLHHGECEDELARRRQPTAPAPARTGTPHKAPAGPRFVADSAVLDVDGGWLSTDQPIALPDPLSHMGDLHTWALESRLGFGGNRNHYPEPGHVWLAPALCAQLGLPTGPFETMAEADQALSEMRQSPFLAEAEVAGWTVTVDAKQPWLRLRRDRRTVIITGVGWGCGRYDLLLHGEPSAQELAGRLGYLCRLLGYPYTVSPANTGLLTLAYHTTHGLPPVEVPSTVEFNDVAANPSWFDADTVAELAQEHPDWWVHEYDRRASYAAASGSAVLGTGPALHHPDGCDWDKRVAGTYRIAPLDMPAIPQLLGLDPRDPKGEGLASGWLSRSAVQWLFELGLEPEILEAYTWAAADSGTQLKSWQAMIRDARQALEEGVHEGNPHALAIAEAGLLKGIYAGAIGKLAATNGRPLLEPSWRYYPHWRAEIIGTHTVNTLRAVLRLHKNDPQHRLPVAIGNTDAVVYVGASPDPADVWPISDGPDALSSPALGKFKPIASIQLGHWLEAIEAEKSATKPRSRLQLIAKAGREWT